MYCYITDKLTMRALGMELARPVPRAMGLPCCQRRFGRYDGQ
jgi:hypothetical protein